MDSVHGVVFERGWKKAEGFYGHGHKLLAFQFVATITFVSFFYFSLQLSVVLSSLPFLWWFWQGISPLP